MQRTDRPRPDLPAPGRLVAGLLATAGLAGCADTRSCPNPPCPAAIVHLATLDRKLALPIELNGRVVEAALDTGAANSIVTMKTARTVGARPYRVGGLPRNMMIALSLDGYGGRASGVLLGVHDLRLAGGRLVDAALIGLPTLRLPDPRIGGLVGGDLLRNWDLDLDVGAGVLDLDLPQEAPALPPWHHATTRVPIDRAYPTLIRFTAVLDGHPVRALLDTGAAVTVVASGTAAGAEVAAGDRGAVAGGINGVATPVRVHHFADLSIGGLSFGPIDAAVGRQPLPDCDMVIGVDVLSMTRFYVAYGAHELLIDEGAP